MKIIILTEGGPKIGLGHIARCSALYEAFETLNHSPLMIVKGDTSVKNILAGKHFLLKNWTQKKVIDDLIIDTSILIIDSYLAKEELCHYISKHFQCVVFLDDTIRLKYPKGILVNGAMFAEEMNYPENPKITYLLGNAYTTLRKPFWEVPKKNIADKIARVLITMGSNDIRNLTPNIIQSIHQNFSQTKLKVIVGNSFKNIIEIKNHASLNTELIFNADDSIMKDAMIESDIAISAAGQTLYELARMGVPTIAISIADNQKGNVYRSQKAGFIEFAGEWNDKSLNENILKHFSKLCDKTQRQFKSECGQKFIDGQGATRVAKKIFQQYFEKNMLIRKVTLNDIKKIYELSNDDTVRQNSCNQEKIEFSKHKKWFYQKLNDENCLFLIAEINQKMVGQIRFDIRKDAIISISIHKDFRNIGIGKFIMVKALQLIKKNFPSIHKVIAFVKNENIISKKYFEKCNFKFINLYKTKEIPMVEYHYYFNKTI